MNAGDTLRSAMHKAGLPYDGPVPADGKIHRFRVERDHELNSWFVLYAGPPAAGAFGCWKRGFTESWCERSGQHSPTEWNSIRERWREADRERELVEAEGHADARKVAADILHQSAPATSHPYLTAKGIRPHGVLEYRGDLVLPLRDAAGALHSLQFIKSDGSKKFLFGGRVAGCFFSIGNKPDSPLVLCEGYATGASIHEATGHDVVCAMNCGNLRAVSKSLRVKYPEREFIIAGDHDQFTDGNPGVTKATEAAKATDGKLAVPQFKDITSKPTDFNDIHQLEGIEIVKEQIEAATSPKETDQDCFDRLAKLSRIEFDRCRDTEAKRLNIRVGTLDAEVLSRRPKNEVESPAQGSKVSFAEVQPWDSPVNGAELLNAIALTLERFVVAPVAAIIAASLFALHTYAFDLGDISPILFITGPTKRCGKSKLLAVLLRLVCRPFPAASATPAGIYRVIEIHHPTLGIDEVDAFMRGDEQLRGLINSGHTRDAAFHLGCAAVGDSDFEPRRWSTWTPKIFSGIGSLADTIEDRAIIVEMVRRRRDEPCERLRHSARFDDIPRKAIRFVNDHVETIRTATPTCPAT